MHSDSTTKRLTTNALFVALTMVVTMQLKIPSPITRGYLNLGDSIILLAGFLLGPAGGFWAGALGSALADLALGYTAYAPITFVVKGLEGAIAALLFKQFAKGFRQHIPAQILAGSLAGIWMAVGYAVAESAMYGKSTALAELPNNICQGLAGMILAVSLFRLATHAIKKMF